jgi:hypothetical protein
VTLKSGGVSLGPAALWAGTWALWLGAGFALPVPPWRAQDVLRREEQAALALAVPAAADAWSIDVGAPRQSRALGAGWSVNEAFLEDGRRRSFAWVEGPAADVAFASPGWPTAVVTLRASPLQTLAPLTVDLELDHEARASLVLPEGWTVGSADVGAIPSGVHLLTLRPRRQAVPPGEARSLSVAVDGLAVGPATVPEPDRDRGVFVGTLNVGLEDRTALFVSTGAEPRELPPGSASRRVSADLVGWYGFGIGGAAGAGSAVLLALHGLSAAALVTLIPGLCWSGLLRTRGAGRIALALALSTVVLLAVLLALRWTGRAPTPLAMAAGLVLLGGAPLPFLRGRGRVAVPWPALLTAAVGAAALTWFALVVVPPLEDQDMEMQATAHALATRQTPTTLTNRSTAYYFAHPPLLHFWQAGTFALSGRLSRVAYYDEAGRRAARGRFLEPPADAPLAKRPHYEEWKPLLRRFLTEPQLWPAREVSVLLAAVAVGLLATLAGSLTASAAAGIALAAVFVTFPESLVRGAYGAYFAAPVLVSLVVLACLDEESGSKVTMLASAMAFLVDQKGLLVPAAWALAAPWATRWKRFLPLAGGLLGAVAFLSYGLVVDAPTFLFDFVSEHVTRRLAGSDIRFARDAAFFYPSIPELWADFLSRYGVVFAAWAALACVAGLLRPPPLPRAASASVLLGALVFSAIDWRQTKHLALLTGPALVAIAGSWPRSARWRRVALVAAAALVLRNLWAAWPLLSSFESLRPRAGW